MMQAPGKISTGVAGLDEIMYGGLIPERAYMIRGGPGFGKTTLGMQFLTAGVRAGEDVLFISFVRREQQLRETFATRDMALDRINFLDLSPETEFFTEPRMYDIFSAAEEERGPTMKKIVDRVNELRPARIFADAMAQFRYLSPDQFQFRKQVLSFLSFLKDQGATVMFTSEVGTEASDEDLQFMCDGVINLTLTSEGRLISVTKYLGSDFRVGCHVMKLNASGMVVFPKLIPEDFERKYKEETIPSGVPELDCLLHGGIERGLVTLITGPTGVGKTTVGLQFMKEAANRGERSVIYTFEQDTQTVLEHALAIGIPADTMLERGTLCITHVEPLQLSPDEFACIVRDEVEGRNTRIVMIDSIAGYRLAIAGENVVPHIYALNRYLRNMGVTAIMANEIESITGDFRVTEYGFSYLMDNIIFLRYVETNGELRRVIGVLKKRISDFENTMREMEITASGIRLGNPLRGLQGVLRGVPEILGMPPVNGGQAGRREAA